MARPSRGAAWTREKDSAAVGSLAGTRRESFLPTSPRRGEPFATGGHSRFDQERAPGRIAASADSPTRRCFIPNPFVGRAFRLPRRTLLASFIWLLLLLAMTPVGAQAQVMPTNPLAASAGQPLAAAPVAVNPLDDPWLSEDGHLPKAMDHRADSQQRVRQRAAAPQTPPRD